MLQVEPSGNYCHKVHNIFSDLSHSTKIIAQVLVLIVNVLLEKNVDFMK
jgi:hypothetical protein